MIAATALFLAAATPTIDAKAQWDNAQNTTSGEVFGKSPTTLSSSSAREPFAQIQAPPSYVAPPGEGDGQKLPIDGSLWILAGLGIAYGFVCRKRKCES